MPTPPASTKTSLQQRAHARDRLPALADLTVRFRGQFAYLDAQLPDGEIMPPCCLRYGGSAHHWGFAIYLARRDGYEDSLLPSGYPVGTPKKPSTAPAGSTQRPDRMDPSYAGELTGWTTSQVEPVTLPIDVVLSLASDAQGFQGRERAAKARRSGSVRKAAVVAPQRLNIHNVDD